MWKWLVAIVATVMVALPAVQGAVVSSVATPTVDKQVMDKLKNLEQTVESLGRQLMQQQTFVEERIRSDGMSGIKSVRHAHEGTKVYHGDNHIGGSAISAHDHADFDRTIGLGEFIAVMNGVEFRTRHNDYKFRKPARNHNFDAIEDIPFPSVPYAVTSKATLQEQINELREWFKAFRDQDYTKRDYRRFFKPNLCYLEGAWTLNAKTLQEPFQSDRHHLDATSWFDLQEKIRYTSYGGSKSNLENFAYLPTTMYNITDGIPQFAQWNYRILCHPLQQDVPTSYFVLQDDLSNRMWRRYTWNNAALHNAARFKLNEFGTDRSSTYTFLDKLMYEIPGKDNYGVNLTDNAFGLMTYDISQSGNHVLNAGMYHRWYKVTQKGAMGLLVNHRGYHDENMWVAMTTQPNVMPLSIKRCTRGHCEHETRRWSFAIPLEIVYSTPLLSWNPYNLTFRDKDVDVTRGGRNGGKDAAHAYDGNSFKRYYRTPLEFYKNANTENDPANTARNNVGVLDPTEHVQTVAASGFRIFTPDIEGVGKIRLRYPIFPVHYEGGTAGQEIAAIKEMMQKLPQYSYLFEQDPQGKPIEPNKDYEFEMRATGKPSLHSHTFTLTAEELKSLAAGNTTTVTTSYILGHTHVLEVFQNQNNHNFYWKTCDGVAHCWDNHGAYLHRIGS